MCVFELARTRTTDRMIVIDIFNQFSIARFRCVYTLSVLQPLQPQTEQPSYLRINIDIGIGAFCCTLAAEFIRTVRSSRLQPGASPITFISNIHLELLERFLRVFGGGLEEGIASA